MAGFRDVVVLLPGITGSALSNERGEEVWCLSLQAAWKAVSTLGGSIAGLALPPGGDPGPYRATRLMPDAVIVPGLIKIDGYGRIERELVARLDLDPGHNYFPFPYDWRLDCRIAARALEAFALEKLRSWRAESGARDAKLVFVAHSMGGLVARYFLEALGGWKETRYLFGVGTPHRGSLAAVDFLVRGLRKGVGPLGVDLTPLLRSFPSVYQLLPTYRCVDAGPGELAVPADVAERLPHVDPARAAAAAAFHREIEDAQAANAKDDSYAREGYRMVPMVGIEQPTLQSARVRGDKVEMLRERDGRDEGGDGTVPRVSATPRELADDPREIYAAEAHGSLQNADGVLANLHGILTRPDIDFRKLRAARPRAVSLDVDDAFLAGEPVRVRARAGGPATVRFTRAAAAPNGSAVPEEFVEKLGRGPDPDWAEGEFALPPGLWRIRVEAPDRDPVTDLVAVAEA